MDAKITAVSVKGFGCFAEEQFLSLKDRGRVLVTGRNLDTRSAESNGAGKTTIFKAITWGLFGRTVDGLTTNVISYGQEAALVRVTFEVDCRTYIVTRRRTPKTGSLKFAKIGASFKESEDMTQSKAAATQVAIESVLGADFDMFRSTVLFGQGDRARFASQGVGDAERKKIIGRVLGLERFGEMRESCVALRDALKAKEKLISEDLHAIHVSTTALSVSLEHLESSLDRLSSSKMLDDLDREREELARYKGVRSDNKVMIANLSQTLHDLREEEGYEESELTKTKKLVKIRQEEVSAAQRSADEIYKEINDSFCYACGRDFDDAHEPPSGEDLIRAQAAFKAAEEKHQKAIEIHSAQAETVKEIKEEIAIAARDLSSTKAAQEEVSKQVESQTKRISRLSSELAGVEEEVRSVKLKIERSKTRVHSLTVERMERETDREEVNEKISSLSWWATKGLGPKGVPAFAIEQALPLLNIRANEHLNILSGGDIRVEWKATTEGKTGTIKEELTQSVMIEGVPDAAPSGGQQKKIELATEVALAEIRAGGSSKLNMLLLDEALDGLDAQGARSVCQWLEGLGAKSIFVVTHSQDIADDFDSHVLVLKSGGASSIQDEA